MKVGITGAGGFIGRHLVKNLRARGHVPVVFSRSPDKPAEDGLETRPLRPEQPPDVGGLDALVNLGGESIRGRWTEARKHRILESRLQTTQRLVEAMAQASAHGKAPRTLLNASAIGFYGDRGEEQLDEMKSPGSGFLAEVCVQWEAAARRASEAAGARVALVRIGFVLGKDGGGFPMLRTAFRFGLGGKLGSGQQWMSFVHVEDAVGLMIFLLENAVSRGPFNAVCPEPVRNADFTKAVGRALHRPTILPAPEAALRFALGEMSRLLLDSQRVLPKRTLEAGYIFRFPTLDSMLADLRGS
jgi:uncharacterized protein (TIGR01777 family)